MPTSFRRPILIHIFAAFALCASAPETEAAPNVVIILADDLGYGDVESLNPDSKVPTPAFNRLSAEGMTFTDAHTPSSVCTPTRYGLITGRYCWRTRLKHGVLDGYGEPLIDPKRPTLATLLSGAGYHCGIVGKWHLGLDFTKDGDDYDFSEPVGGTPLVNGFHYSLVIPASLDFPPYGYIKNENFTAPPDIPHPLIKFPRFTREGPRGTDFNMADVLDDLTREATEFISEHAKADSPYFLYFPLTAPHKPVWPHERFVGKSDIGPYGDFLMQVDETVGKVMDAIDATGEAEDTLFIVTSDNGSYMYRKTEGPDHVDDEKIQAFLEDRHRANGPYRGTKADIWEAGHRVPFFVRWPEMVDAKSESSHTLCLTDIFATLSEIIGSGADTPRPQDSYSFLPALKGEEAERGAPVIHHSVGGMFAIRRGHWKLVLGNGSGGRAKPKGKPFEKPFTLFNLEDDPAETKDLIKAETEIASELEAEFYSIYNMPSAKLPTLNLESSP